jgi:glucan 1,3-beta-glucosidase
MNFALASMDALQHWFFWTWKTGISSQTGLVGSPLWSYQLGLQNGWLPKDPRTSIGKCASLGSNQAPFDGNYAPWQTGESTSSIPASSSSSFPWPPPSISNAGVPISLMPTYTDTASIITLPPATFTDAPSTLTAGVDGWFDKSDTEGGITSIAGCPYPDEYNGIFSSGTPTAPCTGPTGGVIPSATPITNGNA